MDYRKRRGAGRNTLVPSLGLIVLGLSLLLPACSQSPEDAIAAADALLEAGQVAEALDRLREVAAKDPANDAEIQFAIGVALLRAGRTTEAIFPLTKAAKSEKIGHQAGIVLASTLVETGNFEAAIEATDRLLESNPEEPAALVLRANAALQLHRGELALDAADHLLVVDPDSLAFRHLRANALAEANRSEEAEALFLELVEMESEQSPGAPSRACVSLAKMFADAGENERAIERLRVCEERFGERPVAVRLMVALWDELERDQEATDLLLRAVKLTPDAVQLRSMLGTRLIAADRFDEAEAVVSEFLEEDGSPERWAAVSSVRQAAGNLAGALEAIDQAIEASGQPAQQHLFVRADLALSLGRAAEAEAALAQLTEPLYVRTIQARVAQLQGHPQEALDIYETVLPQWPQNYAVRVFAAQAALDVGDWERAESELLEATRQAPKDSDAAIWLARLYFADGNYEEAAFMALRQLSERGPTHPDGFILAGRAYAAAGRPKAAAGVISSMFATRDGLFVPDAVAELGRMSAKLNGAEQALAPYDELLAEHALDLSDPANEPALAQLLQLLTEAGKLDEAKRRVDLLVASHPDAPILHAMEGRIALLQGDPGAASTAFDRALELDPELPAGLAGRALMLSKNGDLAGASEAMDRAWQLGRHRDYGYMAARLQLDQGNTEVARTRFEELLRLHPDHAGAANDLAWLLADQGEDLERAQQLAGLALRLAPGAEVLDTLGYIQLKQGHANAAIGTFRRSLDARASYATARYHLALALNEAGRTEEARESLVTALETTFPESEKARELLARLEGAGGTVQ